MSTSARYQLLAIAGAMVMIGLLVARFGPSLFAKMTEQATHASGYTPERNPFSPLTVFARIMFPVFGLFGCAVGLALATYAVLGFWGIGPFH